MKGRILLVEDDPDLARGVRFNLEREEYEVTVAADGAAARAAFRERSFDAVLLDLNLPDADGLDLLKELRASGKVLPVVCLTARGQETDVVMGLELGADDYVRKPFGVAELLARLDAVLRRAGGTATTVLALNDVKVDLDGRRARHPDGRDEELTPIETDILRHLWERRGRAVERRDLLKELWGLDRTHTTRTLDNHVARLRKKIERDPSDPKVLVTVHGVGYRLEAAGTSSGRT